MMAIAASFRRRVAGLFGEIGEEESEGLGGCVEWGEVVAGAPGGKSVPVGFVGAEVAGARARASR